MDGGLIGDGGGDHGGGLGGGGGEGGGNGLGGGMMPQRGPQSSQSVASSPTPGLVKVREIVRVEVCEGARERVRVPHVPEGSRDVLAGEENLGKLVLMKLKG